MMLRFPDGWMRGTRCVQPVSLIDLLPTILDIAGVGEEDWLPIDGRSLIGLLDGSDGEDWEAISENPADDMVRSPSFMIRKGRFKYAHIHRHSGQLFDLEADPGEWNNLAGKPEYREIEDELRSRILNLFDPEAIEKAVLNSYHKRMMIHRAMQHNGTAWDVRP